MSDNRVEIEVELSDEVIAVLKAEAESRGISFDDLVNEVLKEEMKKYEKRIWVDDLSIRLDEVMDDIEQNKVKYFICNDKELTHPTAVLMSIDEYKMLIGGLE